MERYKHFELHDFVWDSYFRQWVLAPTRESNAEWERWLGENPAFAPVAQQARQIVLSLRVTEEPVSAQEVDEVVRNTLGKISATPAEPENNVRHIHFYQQRWFRVAASVAFLLITGWAIRGFRDLRPGGNVADNTERKVEVGAGAQLIERVNTGTTPLIVDLPDSSRITLKSGSRISYPASFEREKREVYLSGEAFFSIAKDPERPFLVYANELVAKVLGTSFLVTAYPASRQVTVEVKTGRVSVYTKPNAGLQAKATRREREGVILSPNQKIIFEREEVRMMKTLVEKPEIIVSKSQVPHFEFEDTPVSEAFSAIAKAYGIDILYDEDLLKDCPLTATLEHQPLHEKLLIICKAVEASYEILDGQIIIHSKGCRN